MSRKKEKNLFVTLWHAAARDGCAAGANASKLLRVIWVGSFSFNRQDSWAVISRDVVPPFKFHVGPQRTCPISFKPDMQSYFFKKQDLPSFPLTGHGISNLLENLTCSIFVKSDMRFHFFQILKVKLHVQYEENWACSTSRHFSGCSRPVLIENSNQEIEIKIRMDSGELRVEKGGSHWTRRALGWTRVNIEEASRSV